MARGDEIKTTSKANYACKNLEIGTEHLKKPATTSSYSSYKKQEPKKDYGSWGPIFKDKKTFTDMHLC